MQVAEEVEGSGAAAVIPSRRNRTQPRDHGREMYKWRHQIKNFFARIKEFRAMATRYDKTGGSFAAAISLVAGVVAAT
ncbi:MAG: transposase [Rhodobacteraceae bacterium]|nr:transposase [Paracoccaceae bacterium]